MFNRRLTFIEWKGDQIESRASAAVLTRGIWNQISSKIWLPLNLPE